MGMVPLPEEMADSLDAIGNSNGQADIGDLMMILRGLQSTTSAKVVADASRHDVGGVR